MVAAVSGTAVATKWVEVVLSCRRGRAYLVAVTVAEVTESHGGAHAAVGRQGSLSARILRVRRTPLQFLSLNAWPTSAELRAGASPPSKSASPPFFVSLVQKFASMMPPTRTGAR
jgi:hypothetical protein